MGDKKKLWLCTQVALICVFVIGVWSLAMLPVLFYHLPASEISSNGSGSDSVCSATIQYATASGICLTEFANILMSSNCSSDPKGSIVVVRNEEATATQLINAFNTGASAECISKAVPFLCLHVFGLCGGSGVSIQPTSSECEEFRDTLCQQQWMLAQGLGIDLPDCAMFPNEAPSCAALNESLSTSVTVVTNMSESHPNGTITSVLECTEGFYQENGSSICTPSCYDWKQTTKKVSTIINVVMFISALLEFVLGTAVLLISVFISRKRMFVFPAIFVVYTDIEQMLISTFVLISYIDRSRLFCSSKNLIESMSVVTPFCIISGFVMVYFFSQWGLWMLFLAITLVWNVLFPFHSLTYKKSGKNKYLHIICVLLGLLLPLAPIITSMADTAVDLQRQNKNSTLHHRSNLFLLGGLGFGPLRLPPIMCFSTNSDAIFYSFILVVNTIMASACSLVIIIVWAVHKIYVKKEQMQKKAVKDKKRRYQFMFGDTEKKLLFVLCYYVVVTVIAMIALTLSSKAAPQFLSSVQKNFFCEQGGYDPSNTCSHSDIEKYSFTAVTIVSYVLLAFSPVINMVFVINIKEIKEWWRKQPCLSTNTDTITTRTPVVFTH